MATKTTKTVKKRGPRRDATRVQQSAGVKGTRRAWHRLRAMYSERVRDVVDEIEEAGGLSLRDLIALELAELLSIKAELGSMVQPGDRLIERMESLMLQSRKNLRSLVEAQGDSGGVSAQPVRVPEGLRILPSPDEGDDILG